MGVEYAVTTFKSVLHKMTVLSKMPMQPPVCNAAASDGNRTRRVPSSRFQVSEPREPGFPKKKATKLATLTFFVVRLREVRGRVRAVRGVHNLGSLFPFPCLFFFFFHDRGHPSVG